MYNNDLEFISIRALQFKKRETHDNKIIASLNKSKQLFRLLCNAVLIKRKLLHLYVHCYSITEVLSN